MSIAQLQAFIGHLRQNKVFEQSDIIKVVKQMVQIDRRIGLLAISRGYLRPEQVNVIMNALLRHIDLKFGEAAVQMQMLTEPQVEEILRLQKNDLFIFSQAAILSKVASAEKMAVVLKNFLSSQAGAAPPPEDAAPSKERVAMGRKIREVLNSIQSVAALPGAAQKVLTMLQDPEVDMDKIAKMLATEATLVTKILKIVNSAFYGLRARCNTMNQALVILGLKKIRQIILTAGIMEKFQNVSPEFAAKYWNHSLRAAQWSKELAGIFKFKETEELFLSGLIHNIGELVIVQYFPNEYRQIDDLIKAGTIRIEAERRIIGGTHADIGAFVFEMWMLAGETVQSAMLHHQTPAMLGQIKDLSTYIKIINLAVALADVDPEGKDAFEVIAQLDVVYQPYAELIGKSDIGIGDIHMRVTNTVKELQKMFA